MSGRQQNGEGNEAVHYLWTIKLAITTFHPGQALVSMGETTESGSVRARSHFQSAWNDPAKHHHPDTVL